jgi:hypothetical protein
MTFEDPFVAQLAVGLAVVIPIIGVIMALKWKNRNFKGSPSKGSGWLPRKKKSDDTSD